MLDPVRSVRDPVQGDIRLTEVEAAVVDSRVFQRLRFIRQMGLLHLVFPGATHTRFAHSLGTLDVASRVASRLFHPARQHATSDELDAIDRIEEAFRLAALLHDVGHTAFSHSIEHVMCDDGPFLGKLSDVFHFWRVSDELKAKMLAAAVDEARAKAKRNGLAPKPERELRDEVLASGPSHEQFGLLLVSKIFEEARVGKACDRRSPAELAADVQAIMNGQMTPSNTGRELASLVCQAIAKVETAEVSADDGAEEHLFDALHSLVSGTLDVDRLDYLARDSLYCGVPYGACDTNMLINNLSLGSIAPGERLGLLLHRKAAPALDDMLWSRYQLWVQVLNHKTNAGANAAFEPALRDALAEGHIERPEKFSDFAGFTDDYVLSTLLRKATNSGAALGGKSFIKALVDRRLPRQIAQRPADIDDIINADALRREEAQKLGVAPEQILFYDAKSELLKGKLPRLVSWPNPSRARALEPFEENSTLAGSRGPGSSRRVLHFYVDRDVALKGK